MISLYDEVSKNILSCGEYKQASSALFNAYINKMIGNECDLDKDIVKKLTTTIQYFYRSDSPIINKKGSEILSMLLYVAAEENSELPMIAEHVFNEAGDFPNISLLHKLFGRSNLRTGIFDEARKDFRKSLNTVSEIGYPLTDYQRNLWEHLVSGEDVITSAPTSTGKTHIILKYLISKIAESSEAFVAIVVPTRALISEVASKVYDLLKERHCEDDVEICTFPKEGLFEDRTFFVMTQERLSETLMMHALTFDYLFVDEAHSISDKTRGVLLHMTLQRIIDDSSPQIIISMPSEKYINAFGSIFKDANFVTKTTMHSPVAKIYIDVKPKGRNLILNEKDSGSSMVIGKNFKGIKLSNIVYQIGKGESNIVYCNRTNDCEDVADEIASLVSDEKTDVRLIEASDYVSKFIHKDYTLAANLRKGVAFHYGPLPGVVRRMVETLARDKLIDFITCTSTLAEGVNLPAKNLFLRNPMQMVSIGEENEKLEEVKINNIAGRAGRMLEHFAGNVFLVDPDKWKYKDYFDLSAESDEKIPTYYQVINDEVEIIIKILLGKFDLLKDSAYTHYSVANKLLAEYESDAIDETLSAKELKITRKTKDALIKALQYASEKLTVPPVTLGANPMIGYIQQNNLYQFLKSVRPLSAWVLPHPKQSSFYYQLLMVCSKLHEYGIFLPSNSTVPIACTIATKWVHGDSLGSIIAEQIRFSPNKHCNGNVRQVILTINNDIMFKMASALRCYQLLLMDVALQRHIDLTSVGLHGFIEVGGCDSRLVQLVKFGLSRETAIEINSVLAQNIEIASLNELRFLWKAGALNSIHPITQKEVEGLLL